ncbi:MAG: zinc-binding dehydrogenase [Bermanella sp.]
MNTMQAVVLEAQSDNPNFSLQDKPIPVPRKGQVLVKVEVAPLNPADVMFVRGRYIEEKPLPVVPGVVASGTVVASGGGLAANFMLGKRVCCAALKNGDGPWSQYILTNATLCLPLSKQISFESGCNLLANPTTAWGLMERVKTGGHKALVQNAAAGELGLLIAALAKSRGMPVINIVRSKQQAEFLFKAGDKYVLDSTDPQFDDELVKLCAHLNATISLDAIAGEQSRQLLTAMPEGSELVLYGRLSDQDMKFDGLDLLVGRGQKITGFSVMRWFEGLSFFRKMRVMKNIQAFLAQHSMQNVQRRINLTSLIENFSEYSSNTTNGKTLIFPQR